MALRNGKVNELSDTTTPKAVVGTTTTRSGGNTRTPFLREESFQRINTTPVLFGSLSEAFAYTIFLVLFLLTTTVIQHTEQAYYFSNRLRASILEREFPVTIQNGASSAQKRFIGIQDQNEVWAFIQGPFLESIYGGWTEDEMGIMMGSNRILGGVRFRTVRVQANTCNTLARIPEYSSLVPFCYGSYSSTNEQTKGYGPILNSINVTSALAYTFASSFFTSENRQTTKVFEDLQTCNAQCPQTCGDHYGVERFRYTSECTDACIIQCKCFYEQPSGFTTLCPSPNTIEGIPSSIYSYNWSDQTQANRVQAFTSTYPSSGYVVDLPLNKTRAMEILNQLESDRFLDLATRALIIDFTVYNAYLQLFNMVQVVFEFPPTGGVYGQSSDTVLDLYQYSTPQDTTRIILEIFLVVFILIRWKQVISKWYYSSSIRQYFNTNRFWHGLEVLHLSMFLIVIFYRLYTIDLVYGTLTGKRSSWVLSTTSFDSIPVLSQFARVYEIDTILNSINAVLLWMYWFKYTLMSSRIVLLYKMLERAALELVWFFLYFLLSITAFAQIGTLLFSFQVASFRSLGVSIITLLQAIAGELDYDAMVQAHYVLGPLYYITFYLLLILILLNVFLAILNDAYLQSLSEQEEAEADEEEALAQVEEHDDAQTEMENQLRRVERRQVEQLRKYPFSKGVETACRLLVQDLKRSLNGKHAFKVDPMVITTPVRSPSRKLGIQMKRQVQAQLNQQEQIRDTKRLIQEQEIKAAIETQQIELTKRLSTLVESNEEKSKQIHAMEGMLSSIESLCQQLVLVAKEDMPGTSPRRLSTGGGVRTGGTALSDALKRQKSHLDVEEMML